MTCHKQAHRSYRIFLNIELCLLLIFLYLSAKRFLISTVISFHALDEGVKTRLYFCSNDRFDNLEDKVRKVRTGTWALRATC